MSDPHHADEFLARIFAYLLRAAHDPAKINRKSREMGAIVTAWRMLSVMAPGLLPFGAEQFQRYLLTKGARAIAGAIFSWTQSRQGRHPGPWFPPENPTNDDRRLLDRYNEMLEASVKAMATVNMREMQRYLMANVRD